MIEYLWYRRRSLTEDFSLADAAKQFIKDYEEWPVERLVNILERAAWEAEASWVEPLGYTTKEYESAGLLSLLGEVRERGKVVYDAALVNDTVLSKE